MAPPPRPLPELVDDAICEILLHLPPEDSAHLFRASLVCKRWRRILSDPGFLRRYGSFHRTPPLLGFFHDVSGYESAPRFVPTTTASSPSLQTAPDRGSWAFDCRHGRVLLEPMGSDKDSFVVWDPITGDQVELCTPGFPCDHFAASVLCSRDGCDHLRCADGNFLVVFVASDDTKGVQKACVYLSEAGSWSAPASIHLSPSSSVEPNRGALVGDKIFFTLTPGKEILKFDLGKHCLSVIDPPNAYCESRVLMGSEYGLLGLAGINFSNLYLWSKKVEPQEAEGWIKWRIIKLDTLIGTYCHRLKVIGFAEDVSAIFIRKNSSVFVFELQSGKFRKVCKGVHYETVLPFTSFYTPGCANRKFALPAETN